MYEITMFVCSHRADNFEVEKKSRHEMKKLDLSARSCQLYECWKGGTPWMSNVRLEAVLGRLVKFDVGYSMPDHAISPRRWHESNGDPYCRR